MVAFYGVVAGLVNLGLLWLGFRLSEVRLFCLLVWEFYDIFAEAADLILAAAVCVLLLVRSVAYRSGGHGRVRTLGFPLGLGCLGGSWVICLCYEMTGDRFRMKF